jgi:hypothetical protein
VKRFVTDHITPHPINRHVFGVLVFLACLALNCFAIPVQQYYRGKTEAYWDIIHGNYKGQRCINACIALKPTQEYERRIFKYANVRIETTADCGYRLRGYNEVQWARVDRLYPGAYERAIHEAIEWDRSRLQSLKE